MPIRWTADFTTVTADQTAPTADALGPIVPEALPGTYPKYIAGGAGGDGTVLFPGVSLETKQLRKPKRIRARLRIDPSPLPIPTHRR